MFLFDSNLHIFQNTLGYLELHNLFEYYHQFCCLKGSNTMLAILYLSLKLFVCMYAHGLYVCFYVCMFVCMYAHGPKGLLHCHYILIL